MKSQILTNYNIAINDFKLQKDAFVFSSNVYFECNSINCSYEKIKKETKDYQIYSKLLMFHWDTWLVEGKCSHLFYQKFSYDNKTNYFYLINETKDITKGIINAPPIFTSNDNYDISHDGNM